MRVVFVIVKNSFECRNNLSSDGIKERPPQKNRFAEIAADSFKIRKSRQTVLKLSKNAVSKMQKNQTKPNKAQKIELQVVQEIIVEKLLNLSVVQIPRRKRTCYSTGAELNYVMLYVPFI